MIQKKIILFVSCAHLLLCALILFCEPLQSPPVKKLLVQTVSLKSAAVIEPLSIPEEFFVAAEPQAVTELAAVVNEPPPSIEEPEKEAVSMEEKIEKKAPIPIPSKREKKREEEVKKVVAKTTPSPKLAPKPAPKSEPKKQPKSTPKAKPKPKAETKKPSKAPPAKKAVAKTEKKQAPPKVDAKKVEAARKQAEELARKNAQAKAERLEIAKNEALLSEALSSLDHVGELQAKKRDSAKASTQQAKAPSQIAALASEQLVKIEAEGVFSQREKSYYDELVARLKLALKLPEYGEVKVKLTLTRQGKVTKVQVISSKSRKNKDYIEKMLAHTNFPRFGDNFGSDGEHTFQLNLSNELHY